jgi:LysM repeat protein
MDLKRTSLVILIAVAFAVSARAQDHSTEAAKSEALALKAQIVQLEELKAEIKAQEEKIDKLTQEIAKLTDSMKPKGVSSKVAESAPTAAPAKGGASKAAEPAPTAAPAGAAANPAAGNPTTAGVESPSPSDANVRTHVVAKGETLTQISKQYGVTVEEIEQLNKIEDAKKLQAGQTIKIPVPQPSPGG